MQVVHRSEDTKTSAYSSLCIVLMGLGIAKIDQKPIPKQLSDVPVIAANHLRTGGLICPDHVPILFGVELAGEDRGVHQVTKQHGELPTFGFGRGRWRNGGGWCRCAGRPPSPDEYFPIFIHCELFRLD